MSFSYMCLYIGVNYMPEMELLTICDNFLNYGHSICLWVQLRCSVSIAVCFNKYTYKGGDSIFVEGGSVLSLSIFGAFVRLKKPTRTTDLLIVN